eukprot:GHVQ01008558.1.p1 GENE.GHVQ01008558.1~~GHVQ01008558.1.p1  ORF type:complete len:603 (+),score=167.86 GHVQ01008558.1:305-2113(+)
MYRHEYDLWEKSKDTLDVWFDSGCYNAGREDADLYVEGQDQLRGWFQSRLLTSMASAGTVPVKQILTHGFVVDQNGEKMSKSKGNVLSPTDILGPNATPPPPPSAVSHNSKSYANMYDNDNPCNHSRDYKPVYGADIVRLWVASVDYEKDMSVSYEILQKMSLVYRKFRSLIRFLIGNLYDFDPRMHSVAYQELGSFDRWMLGKVSCAVAAVDASLAQYKFNAAYKQLLDVCTLISSLFVDVSKDRLYVSHPASKRRRTCQTVIIKVLQALVICLAPFTPHLAEEAWQCLRKQQQKTIQQRGRELVKGGHGYNEIREEGTAQQQQQQQQQQRLDEEEEEEEDEKEEEEKEKEEKEKEKEEEEKEKEEEVVTEEDVLANLDQQQQAVQQQEQMEGEDNEVADFAVNSVMARGWPKLKYPPHEEELWTSVLKLRCVVNQGIEQAKSKNIISANTEAGVYIHNPDIGLNALWKTLIPRLSVVQSAWSNKHNGIDDLRILLLVGSVNVMDNRQQVASLCAGNGGFVCDETTGVVVGVLKAHGHKCNRCWITSTFVPPPSSSSSSVCSSSSRGVSGGGLSGGGGNAADSVCPRCCQTLAAISSPSIP